MKKVKTKLVHISLHLYTFKAFYAKLKKNSDKVSLRALCPIAIEFLHNPRMQSFTTHSHLNMVYTLFIAVRRYETKNIQYYVYMQQIMTNINFSSSHGNKIRLTTLPVYEFFHSWHQCRFGILWVNKTNYLIKRKFFKII